MMNNDDIRLGDIVTQLDDEGYIESDAAIQLKQHDADNTAWYLQGLFGCGGWLAAVFLFASSVWCLFLTLFELSEITGGIVLIILGGIVVTATTIMRRSQTGIFTTQLLLAFHIAGQICVVGGVGLVVYDFYYSLGNYDLTDPVWILASSVIVMNVIVIPLNRDPVVRFLGILAIVTSVNVIIWEVPIPLGLSVLNGLIALAAIVVWGGVLSPTQWVKYYDILRAIGNALPFALAGTIAFELANGYSYDNLAPTLHNPLITGGFLLILVLWQAVRTLREYGISYTETASLVILGVITVIALPTLGTPGILAGVLFILLGYRRKNRSLLGLSFAYLAGFISWYYYTLQYTLLVKSLILLGTGILLLIGRLVFRRYFPQETPSNVADAVEVVQ